MEDNKRLLIKVCGMRDEDNMRAVASLDIDMMGFIFYPKSPRYVSQIMSRAGIIPDYSKERLRRLQEMPNRWPAQGSPSGWGCLSTTCRRPS